MKEPKLEFGECELYLGTGGRNGTIHWMILSKRKAIRNRSELKEWLKQLRKSLTIASLEKTMIRS
jgi:hypothetical protein